MQTLTFQRSATFEASAIVWTATWIGVGAVFLVLYVLSYPRNWTGEQIFNSPRENIGYLLAERASSGDGFNHRLLHHAELPEDLQLALTPRDAAALDGEVLPKDFAGTMVFHAALLAISPVLVLVISPLFGVGSAWVGARIGSRVFGRDAGLLAFAFLLSLPPLWINSSYIFMGDSIALFFLLLATNSLLSYWQSGRWCDLALVGVCGSISILFRYPNTLFAVPILLALMIGGRLRLGHLAIVGIATLPAAATIILFNWTVYGAPETTGFGIGAEILASTANFSQESFFKFRPEVMLSYIHYYGISLLSSGLIQIHILFLPVIAGLLFAALKLQGERNSLSWLLGLLTLTVFAVFGLYYGNQDAWGFGETWVNASILRYLLPPILLTGICFCGGLIQISEVIKAPILIALVIVSLFVAGNISHTYHGPGGIKSAHETVSRLKSFQAQVYGATEVDAIIATRQLDKVIFPGRQTLTLTYAIQNPEPVSKGRRETWEFTPNPERFAEVADVIVARGIPFYVLADSYLAPRADYEAALSRLNLRLTRMPGVTIGSLLRIEPLQDVE
jgi:hypothetical protein